MVVHAMYENGVFRPLGPVELPDGRQVEVLIGTDPADNIDIDGPDWKQKASSPTETRLLEEINKGLTAAQWNRYHTLIEKRQQQSLSDTELEELTATSERIETMNVHRMECLVELAQLRGLTISELMGQLGISPPQVK